MDEMRLIEWFNGLPPETQTALLVIGAAIAIVAGVAWGTWSARRKIEHWAKAEGLELVSFVVIDRYGVRREGHVMFTGPWHGFGPEDVEVQWEET